MGGGTREQEVRVAPHEDWQASGSIARAKWPQGLCPQHGAGGEGGRGSAEPSEGFSSGELGNPRADKDKGPIPDSIQGRKFSALLS